MSTEPEFPSVDYFEDGHDQWGYQERAAAVRESAVEAYRDAWREHVRQLQARATQEASPQAALIALGDLVALEDERLRLRALHERGHGTDYDHYQAALPLAWEAARAALKAAPPQSDDPSFYPPKVKRVAQPQSARDAAAPAEQSGARHVSTMLFAGDPQGATFSGFLALPAPSGGEWWEVLGPADAAAIKRRDKVGAQVAVPAPDRDAYEGCREDLLDWKRRALAAEAKVRELDGTCSNLTRALGEEVNGPTFMGEPLYAGAPPAAPVELTDAQDAARYRWLRGGKARTSGAPRAGRMEVCLWEGRSEGSILKGEALDAAIDRAILAAAEQEKS